MGEKEKNLSQECIAISQLSYRFVDHIQAICVIKKKKTKKKLKNRKPGIQNPREVAETKINRPLKECNFNQDSKNSHR